jgi:hypothetical protein
MVCTDAQVRRMMREREIGKSQEQAALKANVKSRKTVAKYEQLRKLPSELKGPRGWRTRLDPFEGDWGEVEGMLVANPGLEAKTLFEWLKQQQPGKYEASQLRTLQRRIARWRALHVEQVASLAQERKAGEVMETDGTWLSELGVTIAGVGFKHLLIHCVLPYSNWEWGYIAQSESVLAVREAIQRTIRKLGSAPAYHQTDNSTAATYQLNGKPSVAGEERAYHPLYLALLSHYGMQPRRTHVASPDENGDVEASNGGLKRALRQQLLLRGSRDFASVAAYEAFVYEVMAQRNRGRQAQLQEELAVMKCITQAALVSYRERRLKVSAGSLLLIQTNFYSVPTSLIGQTVTVRQYEWHLEVYYQQQLIQTMPRLLGRSQHHINYRHLVESLLRKPGGFRNYRYQPALFPQLVFRQCWDQFSAWYGERKADLSYLRILRLAAQEMEGEVAIALTLLLEQAQRFDEEDVAQLVQAKRVPTLPTLASCPVDLQRYDALLQGGDA